MDSRKTSLRFLLPVAFCSLAATAAWCGPIIESGQHPNLDSQFSSSSPFDLAAELARQFPQSAFVYQPPLIGYFSPQDPAALVIWTSIAPSGNAFMARWLDADVPPCANGSCVLAASPQTGGGSGPSPGGTTNPPPSGGGGGAAPIDPGASPIPEPGSLALFTIGGAAALGAFVKRRN